MTVDIRRPTPEEFPAYYRVLPYANGLPFWEPATAAWHGGPEPWPPMRAPASTETLARWATAAATEPHVHPVAAVVDGTVVGGSAMVSMEVTVPGGSFLAAGGVTATGVIATHRRRGLLRQMVESMFHAAVERHEPVALLSASEGSIYERFGFHPATYRARWEIARSDVHFRTAEPDPGSLELVDAAAARQHWPTLQARIRATRTGELSPQRGRWDWLSDDPQGTDGPLRFLLHRDADGNVDGVANYRLPWSTSTATVGTLVVEALEATTPLAYRALWALLLDFDLTRAVVAPGRPRDEPLRWMLTNPRALRITRQSDNLWARILDVQKTLEARSYGSQDTLVLRVEGDAILPVNNGHWRLAVDESQVECTHTDAAADLAIDLAALSGLYLGGGSAHDLAYAGRIRPASAADADTTVDKNVERLSRMFRSEPEPHNSFGF